MWRIKIIIMLFTILLAVMATSSSTCIVFADDSTTTTIAPPPPPQPPKPSAGIFQPIVDAIFAVFEWLAKAATYIAAGVAEGFLRPIATALGEAYAVLALNVPVAPSIQVSGGYLVNFGAIDELFNLCLLPSYFILVLNGTLSVIVLALEVTGVTSEGEALACVKRVLLAAALIPLSKYIYNYLALFTTSIAYAIAPPDKIGAYIGQIATFFSALVIAGIFSLGSILVAFFIAILPLYIAAAMRLLLTAVLAGLLPLSIALAIAPIRFVRNLGMRMLSLLFALLFAPIVIAAIIRVASEAGSLIPGAGPVFSPSWWVALFIALVIWLSGLAAPLIAVAIVHEAGLGLAVASGILSFAARPLFQQVMGGIGRFWPGGTSATGSAIGPSSIWAKPSPALAWLQQRIPGAMERIRSVASRLPLIWYPAQRGITGLAPKLAKDLVHYRRAPVVLGSPPKPTESFKEYVTFWSGMEHKPERLRKALEDWTRERGS